MEYVLTTEHLDVDPLPGGLIVEHYRPDPGRRVITALAWGSLVIILGMFVIGSGVALSRSISPLRVDMPARPPIVARYAGGPVDANGNPIDRTAETRVLLTSGALGLAVIVLGGAVVLLALRRELGQDRYLALRTDGVVYRDGARASGVLWADVEEVVWDDADQAVLFIAHDGEVWRRPERYAGTEGPALAKRAAEVRRKALFGLYR